MFFVLLLQCGFSVVVAAVLVEEVVVVVMEIVMVVMQVVRGIEEWEQNMCKCTRVHSSFVWTQANATSRSSPHIPNRFQDGLGFGSSSGASRSPYGADPQDDFFDSFESSGGKR